MCIPQERRCTDVGSQCFSDGAAPRCGHAQRGAGGGEGGPGTGSKLPGSLPRVLDRKGCLNAPLAPRAYGSISVEGRVAGAASVLKRQAIVKGGL